MAPRARHVCELPRHVVVGLRTPGALPAAMGGGELVVAGDRTAGPWIRRSRIVSRLPARAPGAARAVPAVAPRPVRHRPDAARAARQPARTQRRSRRVCCADRARTAG